MPIMRAGAVGIPSAHLLLEAIEHQPANFRSPALAEFADGRLPSARRRNPLHDATSYHLWLSEGPDKRGAVKLYGGSRCSMHAEA
jgi:hypothetical protein